MILYRKFQGGGDLTLESDYDKLKKSIISKKSISDSQLENYLGSVALHESKYIVKTPDGKKVYKYLDPKAKQVGGGPGRGLFMIEPDSAQTAKNRTINYLSKNKMEVPSWLKNWKSNDATELSAEQQKFIMLGNYMEMPGANFSDLGTGKISFGEFWGKYHQTTSDPAKIKNFNTDKSYFMTNYAK